MKRGTCVRIDTATPPPGTLHVLGMVEAVFSDGTLLVSRSIPGGMRQDIFPKAAVTDWSKEWEEQMRVYRQVGYEWAQP